MMLPLPRKSLRSFGCGRAMSRLHWVSAAISWTFAGFFTLAAYRSERPSWALPMAVHLMMSPLFSRATAKSAPLPLISA